MVYDCFSFFNELDLLEIRLNTLDKVVDKFVLVEAPWTHTGHPKPLFFKENMARFAPFLGKIVHVVADDPPASPGADERENAWIRENWQRNSIVKGLVGANPDDILIISDLDEIPDPSVVRTLAAGNAVRKRVFNLHTRCYAFFLNNRCISSPYWTGGPQILSYGLFADPRTYRDCKFSDTCPEAANALPSATLIRFAPRKKAIRDAGWHFSSMGGVAAVQKKIASFAHTEFKAAAGDPEEIRRIIMSGRGFFGFGDRYMPEPLTHGFPPFLADGKCRFPDMILPADETAWRKAALKRSWFRAAKNLHTMLVAFAIRMTPAFLQPFMRKLRKLSGL